MSDQDRPPAEGNGRPRLRLRRLGIDTHQEPVVYMRHDCSVCRSEGFEAQSRVLVSTAAGSVLATLNVVRGALVGPDEAGLSEAAWRLLSASDGELASFSHPRPVGSLAHVRAKIYGARLGRREMREIVADVVAGRYGDVHLAAFLAACAGGALDLDEVEALTGAMVETGNRLDWGRTPIVDKHSVGGLPGNRTTPILVSIVAALGLTMPKTSSRAITSPSGTADTMETLTRVDLTIEEIRRVVEREGGCIAWGGAVDLSPADDVLIRVERALDLDSQEQLVASVLSKKIAAGSTHAVLDVPVGPTAKVRSEAAADEIVEALRRTAERFGLSLRAVRTDGTQPVGRGIGPALEARDVLAVLGGETEAPADLRARAVALAGSLLELAGAADAGAGTTAANAALASGAARRKFEAICAAQGGLRDPPRARWTTTVEATARGRVGAIDNRRLARVAKLAGAPAAKAAGLLLHVRLGTAVDAGEPLFEVHAESRGELAYALDYAGENRDVVRIDGGAR